MIKMILFVCIFLFSGLIYCQSSITYEAGTNMEIQSGADVCADAIYVNGSFTGTGTICQGALPVLLSSFTFSVNKNNVTLSWQTEAELNNSGFDIERKELKDNSIWVKAGFVTGNGTVNEQKFYTFEDKKIKTGKYKYRLKQIDYNGYYEYFSLDGDVSIEAPGKFSISQNYPNPSNPKSKIDYELPFKGKISIIVYDILGKEVAALVNEIKDEGYYTAEFDGSNLASGVYFYRINAESGILNFSKTLKMILVK
ncbi:MAG TPA: T9SS type A sorting domain-containing protein [Ignavibacteria bacterium]|nr:T9SS type A sorting domain-containing protein [Ignavibacteria bacterium]